MSFIALNLIFSMDLSDFFEILLFSLKLMFLALHVYFHIYLISFIHLFS